MSMLKDLIREAPVHERRLELRTYPLDNGQLIVEGWLKDCLLYTSDAADE